MVKNGESARACGGDKECCHRRHRRGPQGRPPEKRYSWTRGGAGSPSPAACGRARNYCHDGRCGGKSSTGLVFILSYCFDKLHFRHTGHEPRPVSTRDTARGPACVSSRAPGTGLSHRGSAGGQVRPACMPGSPALFPRQTRSLWLWRARKFVLVTLFGAAEPGAGTAEKCRGGARVRPPANQARGVPRKKGHI